MSLSNEELTKIGLNIEVEQNKISERFPHGAGNDLGLEGERDLGEILKNKNLIGYTLLAVDYISDTKGNMRLKCIAYKDPDGNVYVHFTGTGDGNWDYNKAAYDSEPSKIQTQSAEFLEQIIRKYGTNGNDVYVTGHSQGGNTAQYATLTIDPEYGKYITLTISADGPGFSKDVYNNELHQHGDAYYESQLQKIYAFNGHSDYVNPLGQVQIILEDHKYMIKTGDDGLHSDPKHEDFVKWHCANYMLTGDGELRQSKPYDEAIAEGWQSGFQWGVIQVNQGLVNFLPDDQQRFIAILVMAIVESLPGEGQKVSGDFLAVAYEAIRLMPGADAVIEQLTIMLEEKGFENWQDIWEYICEDPLKNTLELFSYVFGNKEALMGLMKMAGFIAFLAVAIPYVVSVFLPLLMNVVKILAAIFAAIQIIKLMIDFLVEMWDTLCDLVEATIDFVTKLANDIYQYVRSRIEAAIDVTVETVKYLYESGKKIAKEVYDNVVTFVNCVKDQMEQIYTGIKQTAKKISNAVCGYIQKGVTLQMALLQECADRMNAVAGRVERIDTKLDTLYVRLCAAEIEQGEGIFTTLASLYNLARADLNVDEGNRIRRMANNLTEVNEGYKKVEQWAQGLTLGG